MWSFLVKGEESKQQKGSEEKQTKANVDFNWNVVEIQMPSACRFIVKSIRFEFRFELAHISFTPTPNSRCDYAFISFID